MTVTTAIITGDGSTHALSATQAAAKWVLVKAITVASAAVRIGGPAAANVTSSLGIPLAANAEVFFPQDPTDGTARYDLTQLFYNATNNDTFVLAYAL